MSTTWATAGFENVVPGCGPSLIPGDLKKVSTVPCLANPGLRYKGRDELALRFVANAGFLRSDTDTLLHPDEGPALHENSQGTA